LSSLWKLFRGKKWNPLRQRTDSLDFHIDQLLLGTMLFTVTSFLLPTTAVYYFFFAFVKVLIGTAQFCLLCLVELLDRFPIYSGLAVLVDNHFLPGGIRFEVLHLQSLKQDFGATRNHVSPANLRTNPASTYLHLHNRLIPMAHIFWEINSRIESLFKRYSLSSWLRCLCTGEPFHGVKATTKSAEVS